MQNDNDNNNGNRNQFFTLNNGAVVNSQPQNASDIKFAPQSFKKISDPDEMKDLIEEYVDFVSGGDYFLTETDDEDELISCTGEALSDLISKIEFKTYVSCMEVSIKHYKNFKKYDMEGLHDDNNNDYNQIVDTSQEVYDTLRAMKEHLEKITPKEDMEITEYSKGQTP